MKELIREISADRPLLPRGLRQHGPQRHRRPLGRRLRATRSSTRPPTPTAYVRYFVRHPTTQLMPRKIKTAFIGSDDDRAITGIHDIGFIPRDPRRRQGLRDPWSAAAPRSCRASRRPSTTSSSADDGEYLKVTEAVLRIFDRQDWLRVNRARARIKVLVDKIGIDAFREMVDARARGRLGRRARLRRSIDLLLEPTTRRPGARRAAERPARPTATAPSSTRFVGGQRSGRSGRRASRRSQVDDRSAATSPRSSSAASAAIMREFTGGYARTTVQQNFVLRWVRDEALYDVCAAARRARPRRGGRRRDHRRRQLPRHRQLQDGHHQLDGPQPGDQGAHRGDGDHRSADPQASTSR